MSYAELNLVLPNNCTLEELQAQSIKYIEALYQTATDLKLSRVCTEVDHVCYRVGSVERYEELKRFLLNHSSLMSEAYVNGRPISCFKLNKAFAIPEVGEVSVFELPAPKPGKVYKEGFEHIELVTPLQLETVIQKFNDITWNTHQMASPVNPDISFETPLGVIKLHPTDLDSVIEQERFERKTRVQSEGKKLVIFDFDDTLASTNKGFLKCMQLALSTHLKREVSDEELAEKKASTFPEFFNNFEVGTDKDFAEVMAHFQKFWSELPTEPWKVHGIESLVSCLDDEDFELAVWTARDTESTNQSLKSLGLDKHFSHVFGCESLSLSKPKPCQELLDLVSRAPKSFMVGDSLSDKQGAEQLKAQFIQATWCRKKELGEASKIKQASTPFEALPVFMAK